MFLIKAQTAVVSLRGAGDRVGRAMFPLYFQPLPEAPGLLVVLGELLWLHGRVGLLFTSDTACGPLTLATAAGGDRAPSVHRVHEGLLVFSLQNIETCR